MSGVLINDGVLQMDDPVSYLQLEPLPPYVHFMSTGCHSCDRYSQDFPVLFHSSTSVYSCEHKRKQKWGRPGTKLIRKNLVHIYIHFVVCAVRVGWWVLWRCLAPLVMGGSNTVGWSPLRMSSGANWPRMTCKFHILGYGQFLMHVCISCYCIVGKFDRDLNLAIWQSGWNCQIKFCQHNFRPQCVMM